jgi:hypothetical protein
MKIDENGNTVTGQYDHLHTEDAAAVLRFVSDTLPHLTEAELSVRVVDGKYMAELISLDEPQPCTAP